MVVMDGLALHECSQPLLKVDDLPWQLVGDLHDKTSTFTHAFDVIKQVDPFQVDFILKLIQDKTKLPSPFHFKTDLGHAEIQYVLVDADDGTKTLIKHVFIGANRPRMLISKLRSAAVGEVYTLDISKFNARRLVPQTVQYLLQGLPGAGLFKKFLQAQEIKNKLVSEAQIDEAFDYIEENAPLGSVSNEAMRWIAKEKNNPASPIFLWPEGKIEKAIHNLASGKSLCKLNTTYPLSLFDFKNWVLQEVLAPCVHGNFQHSILFAGISGIGSQG